MYHVPLLALVTRFVGSSACDGRIGRYRKEDLLCVKELIDAGKYRPVIDRSYPLEEAVDANRYVETGQKTGNVVLTVEESWAADKRGQPPRSLHSLDCGPARDATR